MSEIALSMSLKCCCGPLKDTDSLPYGPFADVLLHPVSAGEIDLLAEEITQANLEAAEAEQRDAGIRGKVSHEVDVGLWGGIAAGDGAEEAQMGEAGRLEFRGVAAEDREDAVPVHLEKSLAQLGVLGWRGYGLE